MPTITNFGDLVVTGNVFVSGIGTSTFVSGITSSGIITAAGFTGGTFQGSTVSGTTITASTGFTGAAFSGGTFQGSTVSGTTITASTGFTGAAFSGGTFQGSTVSGTTITASTGFTGAAFTGTSFNFPSGGNITIAGSTATSGYYLQTNGTQVQWAPAATVSTTFTGTAFNGGTFQGSTFSGTTITASTGFTGGSFQGSTVSGTTITASTGFTGAAFSGGTFQGSTVSGTTITASTGFTGAAYTGGTFYGGVHSGTTITASTGFTGAAFTGSSFNFPSGGNITIAGSTATSGYYLQTNGTQVQWAAAVSTAFSGATVFVTGQVSIGSSFSATYPLSVNGTAGSVAAPYSNLSYNTGGWYQAYEPTLATTLQIYTPGRIGCSEVDVLSDRRIKTQIQDTEDCIDLIRKLRVRNFRYIDPVEHGTKTYKGLIAQEVREVIPEAVGLHEGAIPDIFQVATDIQDSSCLLSPGEFTIKIGDVIKVMDGETSKNLTVLDLSEGRVNFDSKLESQKVFVYGHVVSDFHTVSYDRLVPILIRSVQQLIDHQYRPTTPTSSDGYTS